MDYDKVSALANTEEKEDVLKIRTDRMADSLYSHPKETRTDNKEFIRILMSDIIGKEESSQKDISEIITK